VEDAVRQGEGGRVDGIGIKGVGTSDCCSNIGSLYSGAIHTPILERSSFSAHPKSNNNIFSSVNNKVMGISAIPLGEIAKQLFGEKHGVITELATNPKTRENIREGFIDKITPSLPSPSEWLGIKDKVNELAIKMHEKALLTTDPTDDKIDYLQYMYDYANHAPLTRIMPEWFKEIMIYIMASFNDVTHSSIQFIFKHIYKFVTEVVLYTPQWIFDNDWFSSVVSKYSTVSIACVIVFAMIEGIKRMCKLSHTKFTDTLKKLPLALGISAATPYIFTHGLKLLNKTTEMILKLSSETLTNTDVSVVATSLIFEPINILMMIIFLIVVAVLCIPMVLFHARRWFDLTVLGILTPLAMSAWLFESTQSYFHLWLRNIKSLSMVQIAYAVFISILGILMFATPNPTTVAGIFSKILIMTGGIYRLAYPPQFIKRFDDNGGSFIQWAKQMKNFKDDKLDQADTMKGKGEDILVTSAKYAGKGYRFFFKK
jgi:hypothetical protein